VQDVGICTVTLSPTNLCLCLALYPSTLISYSPIAILPFVHLGLCPSYNFYFFQVVLEDAFVIDIFLNGSVSILHYFIIVNIYTPNITLVWVICYNLLMYMMLKMQNIRIYKSQCSKESQRSFKTKQLRFLMIYFLEKCSRINLCESCKLVDICETFVPQNTCQMMLVVPHQWKFPKFL
jgi:hypothetical protein